MLNAASESPMAAKKSAEKHRQQKHPHCDHALSKEYKGPPLIRHILHAGYGDRDVAERICHQHHQHESTPKTVFHKGSLVFAYFRIKEPARYLTLHAGCGYLRCGSCRQAPFFIKSVSDARTVLTSDSKTALQVPLRPHLPTLQLLRPPSAFSAPSPRPWVFHSSRTAPQAPLHLRPQTLQLLRPPSAFPALSPRSLAFQSSRMVPQAPLRPLQLT